MIDLSLINALIVDMDGVLWHDKDPLPGLKAFFRCLFEHEVDFLLATNNASLTPEQYSDKLADMGIDIPPCKILTSAMVTANYLQQQAAADQNQVYIIGETGLREALSAKGFNTLDDYDPERPANYVVCGLDRHLTWQKLTNAAFHLQAGAELIGTNADTNLPMPLGNAIGNGAILTALTAATGKQPLTLGKPEPCFYQAALNILNSKPTDTLAIGDRLDTDILGAVNANLASILLLTGISQVTDLGNIDYAPSLVLPGLPELTEALTQAKHALYSLC